MERKDGRGLVISRLLLVFIENFQGCVLVSAEISLSVNAALKLAYKLFENTCGYKLDLSHKFIVDVKFKILFALSAV